MQDGAGHAPLADRVDDEQLQIGQIEAEAEADERCEEAAEPARVARYKRRDEQKDVSGDADHCDVYACDVGVVAVGNGLAAVTAGEALRGPTPELRDRDVGRDADSEQGENGGRYAKSPFGGHPPML